ncbi:MAG: GAF domain-containing protein [Candidatus Omnitrophota bacterium]
MENIREKKINVTQAQEIKILRRIVEITNSELDLKRILGEVVSIVNDMTKADSVFIYLFDDKKRHLILAASKIPHRKELGRVNLKIGEGITGWVAKENKPVAIKKNAYRDSRFKNFDVLPEDKYEAFLSVPILHPVRKYPVACHRVIPNELSDGIHKGGDTAGVINVQHKKPHEYAVHTISLISIIAKQIGGVIENAQLYEESKKKALQFDSLVKISQSITSQDYLDEILNLIVVVTAKMLNSKICSIMLLDQKGEELVIRATQSLSEEYRKKPNLKVNASISGEVVKIKKPVVIYDVRKEKKYNFRDLAVKENLTSMLSVPMVVKDKAIGIVNVYTKEHHSFTQEEIDVLQLVANQAAVAVENTKLMQETLKTKEALETRKAVERAKGILMKESKIDEDRAYKIIHRKSMDTCKPMREIAEAIILSWDMRKQ